MDQKSWTKIRDKIEEPYLNIISVFCRFTVGKIEEPYLNIISVFCRFTVGKLNMVPKYEHVNNFVV